MSRLPAAARGGILISVSKRCGHCNRWKLPGEMASGDERRGYLCSLCLYNHHKNLRDIAENRPRSCNECGVSFADLARVNPVATMTVNYKDGILQLLCKPCALKFWPKSPAYQGTDFAHRMKLQGYK